MDPANSMRLRVTYNQFDTDLGASTTWPTIRSLRSSPLKLDDGGHRSKLFRATLEQSEQLFRAADTLGTQSAPILLYYGTLQAAVAVMTVSGVDHQPSHGLRLRDGEIHEQGDGNFQALCRAIDSGGLGGEGRPIVAIAEYIPALVGMRADWVPSTKGPWAVSPSRNSDECHIRVPLDLVRGDFAATVVSLRAHRPELEDWDMQEPPASRRGWVTHDEDEGTATVYFTTSDPASLCGRDAGHLLAHLEERPLRPLAAWTALLYGFSAMARYRPHDWIEMLDVDVSADASWIEVILRRAPIEIPALVLSAIRHG